MRNSPPGRTSPNSPAGAPLRSFPASRCLRRAGVNTGAAPPRDRCPWLQSRRDEARREGAPRSPCTGAQVRGLLGWAPDRRGAGKAACLTTQRLARPGTSPAHLCPPTAPPQLLRSAAANPNNAAYSGSGVPIAPAGGRCGGRSSPAPHGRCSPLLRAGHSLAPDSELHFPQGPARASSVWPCPRPAAPRPAPSRRRCRSVGGLERSPPARAAPRRSGRAGASLTAPH